MNRTALTSLMIFGALVAVTGACSSHGGVAGNNQTGGSNSGSGGDDGKSSGASTGSGGSSGSSLGGAGPVLDFPEGGAGPGWIYEPPPDLAFSYDPSKDAAPEECVDLVVQPEPVQLDMFLVLDRSGSMDAPFAENSGLGDCDIADSNNGSRWCNAIKAIYGFVADPSSVDMGIAYTDFAFSPCEGADMTLPFALIESADENGQVAALESALNAAKPGSGTNTESAVNTIIKQTSAHQPLGNRKTIGIIVTDGEPYLQPEPPQFAWQTQACEVESATVDGHLTALNAQLVGNYDSGNGVPTFIMGMDGVEATQLELLAQNAGATKHTSNCLGEPSCSYYSVGNGNPAVFKQALEAIRRSVVGCEFVIPKTQVGLADLGNLEVIFTPDSGEDPLTLSKQSNQAACTGGNEYWLDLSGTEPVLHLCDSVCDMRGDTPKVDISVACQGS